MKKVLITDLRKLSEALAAIANDLEAEESESITPDGTSSVTNAPPETTESNSGEEVTQEHNAFPAEDSHPSRVYSYQEARAILAEKSRYRLREQVKAILNKYGVESLSKVTDDTVRTKIVEEALMLKEPETDDPEVQTNG